MALIKDFEILGTGLVVSNAYHVVTKVDIEKRLQDVPGPVDESRPDGITAGSQEEGKEVYYEDRKHWEYFWLVNSLDGTKEFVKKLLNCSFVAK